MKPLGYEPQKMLIQIRPDQEKKLEKVKYKAKMEKDIIVYKTEIIRVSLDCFFQKSLDEIIEILKKRANEQ